jgi:ABC-type branched-subunit amino acid transport system substrate-binding protein
MIRTKLLLIAAAIIAFAAPRAEAQKKYDPGASDTEIKIGNIMPYSGPASAYGVFGKTEARFFNMINDKGGINERKITFISYDDGYSPPLTASAGSASVRSSLARSATEDRRST